MKVQVYREGGRPYRAIKVREVSELTEYVRRMVIAGEVDVNGYCICDDDGRRWSIRSNCGYIILDEVEPVGVTTQFQPSMRLIPCTNCEGSVRLPTDYEGTLKCPKCQEIIYINDSTTGITWTPAVQESITSASETVDQPSIQRDHTPTSFQYATNETASAFAGRDCREESFQHIDTNSIQNGNRSYKDFQKVTAVTKWCLVLGALGLLTNGFVSLRTTGAREGYLVSVALNPLVWAGIYGLFVILAPKQNERG